MVLSFDRATKIISVPITDTEVTIQTLVNEIRNYEDELSSMDMGKMLNAYGKQPLGGGVLVGITIELLDGWRIMFADRAGPDYTQCSVTGGNVIAYDANDVQQFPIYPSDFVFATITASSSATLSELSAIQYSSFGGGVTVDVINGVSGTAFPIGTIEAPVNNIVEAVDIATIRGFKKLYIVGDITLTTGDDVDGMTIIGESIVKSTITIEPAALVTGTEFEDCTMTGTLDGGNTIHHSSIQTLNYIQGHIHDCILEEYTIKLAGGDESTFLDCWSGGSTTATPIIDMGGSGQGLVMRGYSGGIEITNLSGAADRASLDFSSGRLIVNALVTAGTVCVSGVCSVSDLSTGTAIVHTSRSLSNKTIWDKSLVTCIEPGSTGEAIANLPSGVTKGEAITAFTFVMLDTSGNAFSGSVSGSISKDGGSLVGLTNGITAISSGLYKVDITSTEMDADTLGLVFTGTGARQTSIGLISS